MRRLLVAALVLLAILLAVNTIVTDNETKPASPDIGRVLDLPGGDLQVREDGAQKGTPVVLLHGFASSMHWWTPLVERLGRDFRLIRIDLLGHGGSEKPDKGYSIGHQAEQVLRVLTLLRVERAVIVGHSMGGMVTTALAERDPRRVEGMVLIDTPPDKDSGELPFTARLGFVPVIGEAVRRVVPDRIVRKGLESEFANGFEVPDQFVKDFRKMTYTSYDESHNAADDFVSERSIPARLAATGKPLIVIYGAEDELVDPKSIREYANGVPGVGTRTIPEAGHSPMVDQPGETARVIRAFVRSLAP
jgi:pimeloyl-ACP methyl ester carboxylesterase